MQETHLAHLVYSLNYPPSFLFRYLERLKRSLLITLEDNLINCALVRASRQNLERVCFNKETLSHLTWAHLGSFLTACRHSLYFPSIFLIQLPYKIWKISCSFARALRVGIKTEASVVSAFLSKATNKLYDHHGSAETQQTSTLVQKNHAVLTIGHIACAMSDLEGQTQVSWEYFV